MRRSERPYMKIEGLRVGGPCRLLAPCVFAAPHVGRGGGFLLVSRRRDGAGWRVEGRRTLGEAREGWPRCETVTLEQLAAVMEIPIVRPG